MKRNTLDRREKIKDLILEKGLWSLNKKQLSRDFKVSYPTIYNDIRAILKKIPDDKIEEIGYELNLSFKEALSIARRLLKHKDDSLKLRAIDVLTKAIDRYTSFLEAYGKKPVASKKPDVDAELPNIKLITVGGIDDVKENIELIAKQREISIFDFFNEIFPDEVNNHRIIKKWVNSEEQEGG